jgi:hypothetical protein
MKFYTFSIHFLWCMLLSNTIGFAQSYIVKSSMPTDEFEGGIFIGEGAKLYSSDPIIIDGPDTTIQVVWKDYVGVTQSSNTLFKTATSGWSNAGGISYNHLKSLQNGWISYKVDNVTREFKFGLSNDTVVSPYIIDYAVLIDSATVKVYNRDTLVGTYGSVTIGDSIQIERIGNVIFYTKNKVVFYNQEMNAKHGLQVNVDMYTQYSTFKIRCSFGIGPLFRPYSTLRKKLDGGFYLPIANKLYFKFDEEYIDGTLNYHVIDNSTGDTTSTTIPINTAVKNYGDNRYELDLAGTLTASGTNYYTLKVTSEKNVAYYLRFKY